MLSCQHANAMIRCPGNLSTIAVRNRYHKSPLSTVLLIITAIVYMLFSILRYKFEGNTYRSVYSCRHCRQFLPNKWILYFAIIRESENIIDLCFWFINHLNEQTTKPAHFPEVYMYDIFNSSNELDKLTSFQLKEYCLKAIPGSKKQKHETNQNHFKGLATFKEATHKMKRQHTEWERIFSSHIWWGANIQYTWRTYTNQ